MSSSNLQIGSQGAALLNIMAHLVVIYAFSMECMQPVCEQMRVSQLTALWPVCFGLACNSNFNTLVAECCVDVLVTGLP